MRALPPSRVPRSEPDWEQIHRELQRQKGVTLRLLCLEYLTVHPNCYRYSRVCERHRAWRGRTNVAMRQVSRAGEKTFVDYAGPQFEVVGRKTGEVQGAMVFVGAVLLESFIDSWKGRRPSRLVLAIDSTDDEVHGRQEGGFYHGYYNHYCFLPLYITCGGRPLFALLRPSNADPAGGVREPLGRIVERLRQRWPGLEIPFRADSAYAREEILAWCEDNGVDYVIGLARNSRLVEKIGWELADAQAEAKRRSRPARRFKEFLYATLTSWSRKPRVVGKAEHLPGKSNPRFVVTSLPGTFSARTPPGSSTETRPEPSPNHPQR